MLQSLPFAKHLATPSTADKISESSLVRKFSFGDFQPSKSTRSTLQRKLDSKSSALARRIQQYECQPGFLNENQFMKLFVQTFRKSLQRNALLQKSFKKMWNFLDQLTNKTNCVPTGLIFEIMDTLRQSLPLQKLQHQLVIKVLEFARLNKLAADTKLIKKQFNCFATIYKLNVETEDTKFFGRSPLKINKQQIEIKPVKNYSPSGYASKQRKKENMPASRRQQSQNRRLDILQRYREQLQQKSRYLANRLEWRVPRSISRSSRSNSLWSSLQRPSSPMREKKVIKPYGQKIVIYKDESYQDHKQRLDKLYKTKCSDKGLCNKLK